MKKAIVTISLICVGLLGTTNIDKQAFAQDSKTSIDKINNFKVTDKLSEEEAKDLLEEYNSKVDYIYQGTENTFESLKEKGLKGYVFSMDVDSDLGMFVNEDNDRIYYFHPSGYLKLAK